MEPPAPPPHTHTFLGACKKGIERGRKLRVKLMLYEVTGKHYYTSQVYHYNVMCLRFFSLINCIASALPFDSVAGRLHCRICYIFCFGQTMFSKIL